MENNCYTKKFPGLKSIDLNEVAIGKIIGRGSFGTVSEGLWRNKKVAIKSFEPYKEELYNAFCTEAVQLSRVDHPNIISFFGACITSHTCLLVIEYANCGSLYRLLHQLNESVSYCLGHAINWIYQCAVGVQYLHSLKPRPIVHRDLKSPNLLLANSGLRLKICDFGTACDLQTHMTNNKGSAAWMAPEVFESNDYTEKCDVYSLSILTWEVITRKIPYAELKGHNCRIQWATHKGQRPPLIINCPQLLENLITSCWDKNIDLRPTMDEVVDKLFSIKSFVQDVSNQPLHYSNCSDTRANETRNLNDEPFPEKLNEFMLQKEEPDNMLLSTLRVIDQSFDQNLNNKSLESIENPIPQKSKNFSNLDFTDGKSFSLIQLQTKNVPDLGPVQPQTNCLQSIQIYNDHCTLFSSYVEVALQTKALQTYKEEIIESLQELDSESNVKEI